MWESLRKTNLSRRHLWEMICNFSNWDRKWVPYQGTEWRPTRSPFPWGSCSAPGSCLGADGELGPAGLALLVSSSGPDRSPPCTAPSLCCWGHHTSRTQAAPSTGNTSVDPNSFELKKKKRNTEQLRIRQPHHKSYRCITALHFIMWGIFIYWQLLDGKSINNL